MTEDAKTSMEALMALRDTGIGTMLFRNALARRMDLTLTESLCMTVIGLRGEVSPGELADFAGLTSGAMTTLLDRLEARGFVRRKPKPGDRRGILVESGAVHDQEAKELVAGIQNAQVALLARWPAEDLASMVDFLTEYNRNLREQTEILGGRWA